MESEKLVMMEVICGVKLKSEKDQFVSLCWDIMDCSFEIHDRKVAAQSAIKRFKMWQKLFAETRNKKLSETEVKGLIGELSVLKEICVKKYGIKKAVSGWVGPLGTDRDFVFEDMWYEAKYVSLSMDKVSISSLDQLDTDDCGELVLGRFEKTSDEAEGYITLNSLVESIKELASADENTVVSFLNRMALSGYNGESEQADQPYVFQRFEKYSVCSDSFPRIRRSRVPAAIAQCSYQLSIPALQQWKVEEP